VVISEDVVVNKSEPLIVYDCAETVSA
jgi:hypothetical protein